MVLGLVDNSMPMCSVVFISLKTNKSSAYPKSMSLVMPKRQVYALGVFPRVYEPGDAVCAESTRLVLS